MILWTLGLFLEISLHCGGLDKKSCHHYVDQCLYDAGYRSTIVQQMTYEQEVLIDFWIEHCSKKYRGERFH